MKPKQIVKNLWASSRSESVAFEAMVDFFQTATENQILEFENSCRKNDWDGFKRLVMQNGIPTERETYSIDDLPSYLNAKPKSKT